ncbi:unnamed protein product [Protopolystoma xenopodis]|uniref:Uncharacterized protein n=1 Tax=Protopolystoma xenopodis TaxID=117903 RepID=A0A448XGS5_9PLAT|nr:unnamed protein product [Protopolystoma xenopodis]
MQSDLLDEHSDRIVSATILEIPALPQDGYSCFTSVALSVGFSEDRPFLQTTPFGLSHLSQSPLELHI